MRAVWCCWHLRVLLFLSFLQPYNLFRKVPIRFRSPQHQSSVLSVLKLPVWSSVFYKSLVYRILLLFRYSFQSFLPDMVSSDCRHLPPRLSASPYTSEIPGYPPVRSQSASSAHLHCLPPDQSYTCDMEDRSEAVY